MPSKSPSWIKDLINNKYSLVAQTLWVILILNACKTEKSAQNKDWTPIEISDAKGFTIAQNTRGENQLTLYRPFSDQTDTMIIDLPKAVTKILVTSTTQVGYIEALDAVPLIKGIVGAKYVYSTRVRDLTMNVKKSKHIKIVKPNDLEAIIALRPDVVLVSAMSSKDFTKYQKLNKMGITVIPISAWLETNPLGKAEWIKVFGSLTGKLDRATTLYQKVKKQYLQLTQKAQKIQQRKKVITGLPYQGVWYVPGGKSYACQFLKDAGALYPWANNDQTASITPPFEEIYLKAQQADIWIAPGSASDIAQIKATDERLTTIKCLRQGEVYNHDLRVSPKGGNDYWESAVVRPDLVLADLIYIFYPELLPDHQMYYYRQLP